jgi:SAM-dependent methyltransferase
MEYRDKMLKIIYDDTTDENTDNNMTHEQIVEILDPIYSNLEKTFGDGTPNLTYGEIEFSSLKVISNYFPELINGYFYDLGCGRSKAVLYMNLTNKFKKCIGIDIVKKRIKLSEEALLKLKEKKDINKIKFFDKSFLDDKFNYRKASLIYINNLCFQNELNYRLFNKIKNESKKGTYLFVTKLPKDLDGFKEVETENVIMSWSDDSSLHVLKKI